MSDKVTPIRRGLRDAASVRGRGGNHILPDDCPVVPLGHSSNPDTCHYLNALGQYTGIPVKAHSKLTIYGLFGARSHFLIGPAQWAKGWDEDTKRPKDFAPDKVARDLIAACHEEGPWNPSAERLRGRGAWRGEDDDLIQHLGTTLLIRNQVERPGKRDRYVYTVREQRPGPAPERQPPGEDGPAAELERLLRCWAWSRPDGLDARLLLGWVCAGYLCGALTWRPQVWVSGPPGSGKSTLTTMLSHLFGRGEGCVVTEDASGAGLRTFLGHDSLPVFFDESEPSEDMRRLNALIDLARLAASGGVVLRATQDHGSASFTVRFMGLFSSVLQPSLKGQDMRRIIALHLRPHRGGAAPLLREDMLRALGRRLHRRMTDGWPRFLETLPRWHAALMQGGMDSNGANQFSAVLAAADVALHDDDAPSDVMDEWVQRLVEHTRAERAEQMPEWRRCLEHIITKQAPQWRGGELQSIGRLIAVAAGRAVLVDPDTGDPMRPGRAAMHDANRALASLGLKVVPRKDEGGRWLYRARDGYGDVISTMPQGDLLGWLAVANNNTELGTIFRGTHWAGRSGTDGGWKPALQEAPEAVRHKEMRFGGATSRCVLVPLELVLDGDGEADAE